MSRRDNRWPLARRETLPQRVDWPPPEGVGTPELNRKLRRALGYVADKAARRNLSRPR